MPTPVPLKLMKVGYKHDGGNGDAFFFKDRWSVTKIDEEGIHSAMGDRRNVIRWDGSMQVLYIITHENPEFNKNDEQYKKWSTAYSILWNKWLKGFEEANAARDELLKQSKLAFTTSIQELSLGLER